MKEFKRWLNKPITWKALFIASLVSILGVILELGWIFDVPKKIIDKFKSSKN